MACGLQARYARGATTGQAVHMHGQASTRTTVQPASRTCAPFEAGWHLLACLSVPPCPLPPSAASSSPESPPPNPPSVRPQAANVMLSPLQPPCPAAGKTPAGPQGQGQGQGPTTPRRPQPCPRSGRTYMAKVGGGPRGGGGRERAGQRSGGFRTGRVFQLLSCCWRGQGAVTAAARRTRLPSTPGGVPWWSLWRAAATPWNPAAPPPPVVACLCPGG